MSHFQKAREKNLDLPNIGKIWTSDQENLLLKRVAEGKNHEELSKEFGRTTGGIRSRLREIACEMISFGKSIEYAMEKTQISKELILESVNARKNYLEKKSLNKEKIKAKPVVLQKPSEMREVIDLMKEIRDLLKKFLDNVVLE
jgi:hypothetical protein